MVTRGRVKFKSRRLSRLKMHYLSVYCRFRDEAKWLREWLEYHLLVGVEHFYLFDHLSKDNPRAVLEPYIKRGLVTYTYFNEELGKPHCATFIKMSKQAVEQARGHTRWLALIDSDEFLVASNGGNLKQTLKRYERHPAVVVNWQMFGTNGVEQIPADKLMLELLTKRAPRDYEQNKHIKTILQPSLSTGAGIHEGHYPPGSYAVNTDRKQVVGSFSSPIVVDQLKLHHYFLRDRQFIREVKIPRRLAFGHNPSSIWEWETQMNAEHDDTMLRYVEKLRARVIPPDWRNYLRANPDLVQAGLKTEADAHSHWFMHGINEHRPVS